MKQWNNPENQLKIRNILQDEEQFNYLRKTCELIFNKKIDTWDYEWKFSRLLQGGLTIIPSINLVKNIGFNSKATHTTQFSIYNSDLDYKPFHFPLLIADNIEVDREYDHQYFLMRIDKPNLNTIQFLATEFISSHNNIKALMLLEKAINIYPDTLHLYYLKAITLCNLGQKNRAITTLKHLLNLIPKNSQSEIILQLISELSDVIKLKQ